MKLKLDENIRVDGADVLRNAGFDARTVAEEGMSGASDDDILSTVQQEGRVFITLDLDFSDIRAYPPHDYGGIIVLRPPSQDQLTVRSLVRRLLPLLSSEPVAHRLWVVETNRVRIRD